MLPLLSLAFNGTTKDFIVMLLSKLLTDDNLHRIFIAIAMVASVALAYAWYAVRLARRAIRALTLETERLRDGIIEIASIRPMSHVTRHALRKLARP